MNVLVTNFYGSRNAGDAGILEGMLAALKARPVFAHARFTVASANPAEDRLPADVIPSLAAVGGGPAGGFRRCLRLLLLDLPLAFLWVAVRRTAGCDVPVPGDLRRLLREADSADLVIAAGGGWLYTRSAIRGNVVLLGHLAQFLLPAMLGKPVVLWTQSIGPFASGLQEGLIRRALSRVRQVLVRDRDSLERLEEWGLGEKTALVPDSAFLGTADEPVPLAREVEDAQLKVGMTLRRWWGDDRQLLYERRMAEVVRLLGERGATVVFLPQCTMIDRGDDDRETARRVRSLLPEPSRFVLPDEPLTPARARGLCRRLDLVVGTRAHSVLFALSVGTPAMALSYQPKHHAFLDEFGLGEYVIPVEEAEPHRVLEMVERLLERREEVKERIEAGLPSVRERAAGAAALVEEVLLPSPLPSPRKRGEGPD